ncbi:MAG TPA: hypothetical protein VIV60_15560, partial [Polyangiaceae bacterium]
MNGQGVRESVSLERVVARTCTALVDLREECASGNASSVCGAARAEREEALELGCIAESEQPICEQSYGASLGITTGMELRQVGGRREPGTLVHPRLGCPT